MAAASAGLDYEQAARWRDLIRTTEQIKERPQLISVGLEDTDIFGLARDKDRLALYVFFMRRGKVREAEELVVQQTGDEPEGAALARILGNFYSRSQDLPDKVLLSHPTASSAALAALIHGKKAQPSGSPSPKRKPQKAGRDGHPECGTLVEENETGTPCPGRIGRDSWPDRPPGRIEGFDISNTGGEESVGSVVVFEGGEPARNEYRKYKIKSVAGPNDVASLKEVIDGATPGRSGKGRSFPTLSSSTAGRDSSTLRGQSSKNGADWAACRILSQKGGGCVHSGRKRRVAPRADRPSFKASSAYSRRSPPLRRQLPSLRRKKKSFAS